ncbi:MAG: hypothetical protein ACI8TQ_002855 [Planctomycetota bacterium]|jgi:hypothetical protein
MSDFQDILREALMGEETYDENQGQAELRASIQKFDSQERIMRTLLWSSVVLMTVLCFWSAWSFIESPEDVSTKYLIMLATLFLFSVQSIGWSKMFIYSNQKSVSTLKELKRVQLLLMERR